MRRRDIHRWGVGKLYPDDQAFLNEPLSSGLHSIQLGNELLELFIEDRSAETTLVSFQHRVSVRTPYPTFVGMGAAGRTGANLIAVADPGVALDPQVRLAWYLGTRSIGPLKPILLPILKKSITELGGSRTVFFGTSGGGYPAVDYAREFPASIGLTINPMLGFNNQNQRDLDRYMDGCHPGLSSTPYKRVRSEYAQNLAEIIPRDADCFYAMYHNLQDAEFYAAHHAPFVQHRRGDLRIWERLENDGEGHLPIPKPRLDSILRSLSDVTNSIPEGLTKAGFYVPN